MLDISFSKHLGAHWEHPGSWSAMVSESRTAPCLLGIDAPGRRRKTRNPLRTTPLADVSSSWAGSQCRSFAAFHLFIERGSIFLKRNERSV